MINKENIAAGKFYKLLKPEWSLTHGQGKPPEAMKVKVSGKEYTLPWGTVFKASGSCDPENKIGNLKASGYPTLRIEFIEQHPEQFEEVITNNDVDEEGT